MPYIRLYLAVTVVAVLALATSVVVGAQTVTVVGHHEGSEGLSVPGSVSCVAAGWASDPTQPATDVTVRVLVDGIPVATALASEFRQDLLDAGVGVDGTAAFNVNLGPYLTSGVESEIRVQAQDLGTGAWVDLNDTPRRLTCTELFGYHDVHNGTVPRWACVAAGWAFDANTPATRVQVRVKVDEKVVAETTADEFRPDVRDAGFGDGYSGWTISLVGHVQPFKESVVTAEARDTQAKRLWFPLNNTDKLLTCLPQ